MFHSFQFLLHLMSKLFYTNLYQNFSNLNLFFVIVSIFSWIIMKDHSIDLSAIKLTPETQYVSHSLLLIYVNSIMYFHFTLIWIKP